MIQNFDYMCDCTLSLYNSENYTNFWWSQSFNGIELIKNAYLSDILYKCGVVSCALILIILIFFCWKCTGKLSVIMICSTEGNHHYMHRIA